MQTQLVKGLSKLLLASLCFICIASTFLPEKAAAEVPALARSSSKVHLEPNIQSNVILQFPRVTKVLVLGKRGAWYKVRIRVKTKRGRRMIEGWILKKDLVSQQRSASPAPKPQPKQNTQDDQLLSDLINRRKSSEPQRKEKLTYSDSSDESIFSNHFAVGADVGFRVSHYEVSDANNSIAFDIPGIFIGLEVDYEVIKLTSFPLAIVPKLRYEFEYKNYTVELFDDQSPANNISSTSSTGTSHIFDLGLFFTYDILKKEAPPKVHLGGGYLLSMTDLDDAEFLNLPVNLFTDSKYSHIYIGGGATIPFVVLGISSGVLIDGKYFLVNDFEESGENGAKNISGGAPSAKSGYQAKLGLFWSIAQNFVVDLSYIRKVEGADLTGSGERLSNTSQTVNFNNATIDETSDSVLLGVTYDF